MWQVANEVERSVQRMLTAPISYFISRVIPPLVHAVLDGAVAGGGMSHKNQGEGCVMSDRQFARTCDHTGAARNSDGVGNQGKRGSFYSPAHAPGSNGVVFGVPGK